ncbi:50S ribosomal protein L22 [Leptospirillum sp. Group II 'CF-1']|uniref:Large ribosomal subunit protein uL22 n=1 Tax=Leptospirillum ferriphilum YSK TaxID=1441628 RepID=A0A059XV62_9BACT|nr:MULTISPECIES: 50S ribosomal protein L22 [Leptospirillum]AIA30718.1 50S ribosomal protein L22 [Leptospirillum ferriphilum YSK]AKS23270.1 50S ribosomal protein L22 [Leptospirillum sp. Group II 'CF-1']
MVATAIAKNRYIRIAPRKVRYVADAIRGKSVNEAFALLNVTTRGAVRIVEKTLKSAVSNAVEKKIGSPSDLKVSEIFVDVGPIAKRMQPRAMGRAYSIKKRTSHLTIIVSV